jgi:hypothetical protein
VGYKKGKRLLLFIWTTTTLGIKNYLLMHFTYGIYTKPRCFSSLSALLPWELTREECPCFPVGPYRWSYLIPHAYRQTESLTELT